MGLLDVLNGMQNGPRGASAGRGGMSPITMALLGLLAYKAVKGFQRQLRHACSDAGSARQWTFCGRPWRPVQRHG